MAEEIVTQWIHDSYDVDGGQKTIITEIAAIISKRLSASIPARGREAFEIHAAAWNPGRSFERAGEGYADPHINADWKLWNKYAQAAEK